MFGTNVRWSDCNAGAITPTIANLLAFRINAQINTHFLLNVAANYRSCSMQMYRIKMTLHTDECARLLFSYKMNKFTFSLIKTQFVVVVVAKTHAHIS